MGKSVEREENMELRLDLSMGGSFTRAPDDNNSGLLPPGSGVFPDHCGAGFRGMYYRNKEEAEEVLEQRRRKEMHALRRQAARRKRDEKRGAFRFAKRSPEAGDNNDGSVQTVVPLMQYVVQNGDKVEYIPVTPGSAFPYVVPYWPASSPPPILSRNFDTAAATASWSGNTTNKRLRESDSGESSSSAISEKNRGGSSSASSHPPPEQFEKAEGMAVNNGNDCEKSRPRIMPVAGEKPLKLPQMPCVSTTGDGPNGKTITGFLYRYTKGEVSIMCVCHGESFSPAEFVKHAGGTDVEHPMRHIIIVPSPAG